eukprot:gb/GFBE01013313.1/.p1 GENE.gb/GFBE01013313.1/~~gb/GFBE01013313.1/.p1  ORF type:complete len:196 (+),score=38.53 gb/GFBE01013313.1/:1-588(+)
MALPRQRRPSKAAAWLLAAGTAILWRHSAFIVAFIVPTRQTDDGVHRRDFLQTLSSGTATAVAIETLSAQSAWAAARWSGIYDDPKHPGCERKITMDGADFVISGTSSRDGSKSCEPGSPVKTWVLVATKPGKTDDVMAGPSDTLLIDFSKKGGPKDAVAKWDGDGILFPDGNKWTKIKRKPGGLYTDAPKSPGK